VGLHLSFELRLPPHTDKEVVAGMLSALRTLALSQPFGDVSPLLVVADTDEATAPRRRTLQRYARVIAEPDEEDLPPLTGDPDSAIGFFVNPGQGCETAFFGLLRRHDVAGVPADWYWHCSCKTQYASTVSDAHFITCHTSLINLLDQAAQLGLQLDVNDEGHYWETRDTARLLSEVAHMNQLVARFVGALSDAMGNARGRLQAPIVDHPRFERLEMGES
jgi:hypothetical protein